MFLTSKDLRIGNYINYESTTHVVLELQANKLIHYWLGYEGEGYVTTYNQILAIPLSKKELENLGFSEDRENENIYRIETSSFYIEESDGEFYLCQDKPKGNKVSICPIYLVHEFQNLFFDLTRIELKY